MVRVTEYGLDSASWGSMTRSIQRGRVLQIGTGTVARQDRDGSFDTQALQMMARNEERRREKLGVIWRSVRFVQAADQEIVELQPMTPHDRRTVHMAIAEMPGLPSRSEGDLQFSQTTLKHGDAAMTREVAAYLGPKAGKRRIECGRVDRVNTWRGMRECSVARRGGVPDRSPCARCPSRACAGRPVHWIADRGRIARCRRAARGRRARSRPG